jgi:DNA-binding PadR family transcriptional regulator
VYFDIMVLRVLADRDGHGYEIKKQVERILGGRSINNNVLYPALRKFEEQGAIERVAAEADPGRPPRSAGPRPRASRPPPRSASPDPRASHPPPRKVYRLTDVGHDLLQAMIRDADPALLADENEFQTRVAFFADLSADDRLRILRVRREILEARIAHMETLRPDAQAEPWGLRVMDFSIGRTQDELAWLDALEVTAAGEQP